MNWIEKLILGGLLIVTILLGMMIYEKEKVTIPFEMREKILETQNIKV